MKKLLDTTHTIYSPASKAYEIAEAMQADDPDWTYKVIENPDPTGPDTAIIKVYDNGEFVAIV